MCCCAVLVVVCLHFARKELLRQRPSPGGSRLPLQQQGTTHPPPLHCVATTASLAICPPCPCPFPCRLMPKRAPQWLRHGVCYGLDVLLPTSFFGPLLGATGATLQLVHGGRARGPAGALLSVLMPMPMALLGGGGAGESAEDAAGGRAGRCGCTGLGATRIRTAAGTGAGRVAEACAWAAPGAAGAALPCSLATRAVMGLASRSQHTKRCIISLALLAFAGLCPAAA